MVRVPHVLTAPQPIRRLVVALSLLLPLAAVALVWRPLLGGWFQADDFNHLYDLVTMDRVAFLTQVFAGHLITTFNAATRKSRLFASAISTSRCSRGSVRKLRQPISTAGSAPDPLGDL